MNWEECIKRRIIQEIKPDFGRVSKLTELAMTRYEFWNVEINEKYNALKVEAMYDVIKELILAHMLKNGFNCTNHLCLIAYLEKNFRNFKFEIRKINELRMMRNAISYRAINVDKNYLKDNELEIKHIIKKLIDSYKTI